MTRVLYCLVAAALLYGGTLSAQEKEKDRQAYAAALHVTYSMEGMKDVRVERDIVYRTAGDTSLTMDMYYPPSHKKGERLPVVVFVNGVGSKNLKEWGMYTDWGRLAAASGMIAVTYTSRPKEARSDTEFLLDHLRAQASRFDTDGERICLWSASANTFVGIPVAMDKSRPYVRCAVVYYGMIDVPVLRRDLPVFVARAGRDNYMLNSAIDNFVRTAVQEDMDVTFVNYVDGHHSFDIWDETEESRNIVRQTLDFMSSNLSKPIKHPLVERAPTPSRFVAVANDRGVGKAIELYHFTKKADPKAELCSEASLNLIGYYFLQEERTKDALAMFTLILAEYPDSPNAYDSMADVYAATGNGRDAVTYAEKALAMLEKDSKTEPAMKELIRKSAEEKLTRFREAKSATPVRSTDGTKPEG